MATYYRLEQYCEQVSEHRKELQAEVENLRAELATLKEMNAALRMAIKREALAGYRNHKAYERVRAALRRLLDAFDIGGECDCGGNELCAVCNALRALGEYQSPGECVKARIVLDKEEA
jgi:putative heme degradation protein